ncbi:hypothetical protein FP435_07850 [Lactobacillus sp. PV037]|uniref:hypothetical protein n=1 Tax=unclassified Lactobacillus TaxID=2620435 RepID=UPI0022405774|nr:MULTISPECIES: hypothetical protein [unclassified Lactobacillus]QNQ81621.1 hypothetical protein FP433_00430 [Lactobacillus sp. PV012]QNQ84336.1 hypothetical protein FP435_07850 [Lactobacillus sp. PV037]
MPGKIANMLAWGFDGWVIFMFEYTMTSWLCSKRVVFWLSAIISFILMIIIGLLSIVWMVIAGGYIMN